MKIIPGKNTEMTSISRNFIDFDIVTFEKQQQQQQNIN